MSDLIQIGKNQYTQKQIDAINELFGENFLQDNPHFPNEGRYKFRDGYHYTESHPILLQERQRVMDELEQKRRQHEFEDTYEQPTVMYACAEMGQGYMGEPHKEKIIARVTGTSRKDCREKFTRQHLVYDDPDWEARFQEWLKDWHYVRYGQDFPEIE
jgi:hypothetical protein